MRRNLLYSVYATKHTRAWLDNVERLSLYRDTFPRQRLVIVRSDATTVEPERVEEAFKGWDGVEFIHRTNNAQLGEVDGFLEALGRLQSTRTDEATFYAHTKGVKYAAGHRMLPNIQTWRDAMYDYCLSVPARIDAVLDGGKYACAGAFKSHHGVTGWHYSGNFWWVNHARLWGSDRWRSVLQNYYGVENYLGGVFGAREAFCLAFEDGPVEHLYLPLLMFCGTCQKVKEQVPHWVGGNATGPCGVCGEAMLACRKSEVSKALKQLRKADRRKARSLRFSL